MLSLVLTAGQRHESIAVEKLLSTGAIKRPGRGRPRLRPRRIVGDKAYCAKTTRDLLRRRGIRFTIAKKQNMCRCGPFDKDIYRQRNIIERTINRFKQYRRIATRYEKRDVNYRAMWIVAAIVLAL